jgi:ATP-dependent phosphoenolpyruvate carboxykinase
VVTERAYHALFMHNMLIRPSLEELEDFGEPDFIIYNAGGLSRVLCLTHSLGFWCSLGFRCSE